MKQSPLLKLIGVILLVLVSALYFRWSSFSYTQVYSDSLSPFAGGIQFLEQGSAKPPNPESDHWLWVSTLPFLTLATSLQELFWFRYLGNLVLVLFSMFSAYLLFSGERYRLWGVGAVGLFLGADSGLIDTLISSFRGYFAPEYLAFATIGVILFLRGKLWGVWLAIIGSVLAGGQHPLAMGSFLGLGFLGCLSWRRSRKYFWVGCLIFLCCITPKAVWIWQLLQCDAGGLACLTSIAMSSAESTTILEQIYRGFYDRFWIEMGPAGLFLLIGLWRSRKHLFTQWVCISILGVVLLGLSISTFRPYHFRALAAPMVLASVLGWIQLGRRFLNLIPIWAGFLIFFPPKPVAWKNQIVLHDQIAAIFCSASAPFWVEGYGTEELGISLQGVGVSYWLQGCDPENIVSEMKDNILLIGEVGVDLPIYFQHQHFTIYQLDSVNEMPAFSMEKRVSGYDFTILFVPEEEIILR